MPWNNPIQRAIVGALVRAPYQTSRQLACWVYDLPLGSEVSRPQLLQVQRTLRRLAEQKIIREVARYGPHGRRTWVLDKAKPTMRAANRAKARTQAPRLISQKH